MAELVSPSNSNEKQGGFVVDSEKHGDVVQVQSYYDEDGPVEFEEKAELRLVLLVAEYYYQR